MQITTERKTDTDMKPEQNEMINNAEKRSVAYDEDCPEKTPEQVNRFYRGKIWMSDDFDAPLEEFKDYM